MSEFTPGTRFRSMPEVLEQRAEQPHLWNTLGLRRTVWEPGRAGVEWDATEHYGFPAAGGHIIQGGLVTTVLDAAMGGAAWTLLDDDLVFLTADLRVEFLRSARPGLLQAEGWVVRRARRVLFCAAELYGAAGETLAAARCTQVVLPAEGTAGRYGTPGQDGAG